MRIAVVALLLLAGCTEPSADQPTAAPEPTPTESPPIDLQAPAWRNQTFTGGSSNGTVFELHQVGGQAWVNLTWESNDPGNDELTLVVDTPSMYDDPLTAAGPSPLGIHYTGNSRTLEVWVERPKGQDLIVLYMPPPDQPFTIEATHPVGPT